MNDKEIISELKEIVEKYPDALGDSVRTRGLLSDYFPEERALVNVLSIAFDIGAVSYFRNRDSITQNDLRRFSDQMFQEYGIQKNLSTKALRFWCCAYNVSVDGNKRKAKAPQLKKGGKTSDDPEQTGSIYKTDSDGIITRTASEQAGNVYKENYLSSDYLNQVQQGRLSLKKRIRVQLKNSIHDIPAIILLFLWYATIIGLSFFYRNRTGSEGLNERMVHYIVICIFAGGAVLIPLLIRTNALFPTLIATIGHLVCVGLFALKISEGLSISDENDFTFLFLWALICGNVLFISMIVRANRIDRSLTSHFWTQRSSAGVIPSNVIIIGWSVSELLILFRCGRILERIGSNTFQISALINLAMGAFIVASVLGRKQMNNLYCSFAGWLINLLFLAWKSKEKLDFSGTNVYQFFLIAELVSIVMVFVFLLGIKKLFLISAILASIVIITSYIIITGRTGKVQIPFGSEERKGQTYLELESILQESGFKNIRKIEDSEGWMYDNVVLKILVDDNENYAKGDLFEPNVLVNIVVSSNNRISMEAYLDFWQEKNVDDLIEELKEAGLSNITTKPIDDFDVQKNKKVHDLTINGEEYTEGECYIPKTAPIVIGYYENKVKTDVEKENLIGKNVEDVVNYLKNNGFTVIHEEEVNTGWAEGNTVVDVIINGISSFQGSSGFNPNDEVLVKYSSNDRTNASELIKGWERKKGEDLYKAFVDAGFTNVSMKEAKTQTVKYDKLTSKIEINNEEFSGPDCYIQRDSHIEIVCYKLAIKVMSDKTGFIGKNYNDVKESLEEIGLTDIEIQEIDSGWGKGNMVVDISIDGSSNFSTTDRFDATAKVVIKYNSNDRIDVTSIFAEWREQNPDFIKRKLEEEGFTEVSLFEQETDNKEINLLTSKITIDGIVYSDGDCFIQPDTPIEIGKYILKIKIGESANNFVGENYKEVVKRLEEKGFTNITLYRTDDLWLVDLIHKEGDIKHIFINENDDFDMNAEYLYNANIVIIVITYDGKGCEDITKVF